MALVFLADRRILRGLLTVNFVCLNNYIAILLEYRHLFPIYIFSKFYMNSFLLNTIFINSTRERMGRSDGEEKLDLFK